MRPNCFQAVAASLLCTFAIPTFAGAEVYLSGTADKIVLKAKNATMPEILSGIESTLNYKVRLTGSMTQQFSGTYSGSLRRVLSRLLDKTDYVFAPSVEGINIVLLGPNAVRGGSQAVSQGGSGGRMGNTSMTPDEPAVSDVPGWLVGRPSDLPSRGSVPDKADVTIVVAEPAALDVPGWLVGRPSDLPSAARGADKAGATIVVAEPAASDVPGWLVGRPSDLPSPARVPDKAGVTIVAEEPAASDVPGWLVGRPSDLPLAATRR